MNTDNHHTASQLTCTNEWATSWHKGWPAQTSNGRTTKNRPRCLLRYPRLWSLRLRLRAPYFHLVWDIRLIVVIDFNVERSTDLIHRHLEPGLCRIQSSVLSARWMQCGCSSTKRSRTRWPGPRWTRHRKSVWDFRFGHPFRWWWKKNWACIGDLMHHKQNVIET